jgi:CRP-like cAMP-binding protein
LQTEIPNVAKNPPPNCVLMDMDIKGYARYALRYWLTDLSVDDPTDAALRWHILTALHRADIQLAVEESSVHVTKENEKYEEAVHQREISLRIKTLRKVELFGQMTDDELRKIAERLRYSPFARGNIITKQGDDRSHWLYIVVSGEAEVYLEMPNGGHRILSALQQGHFFGEMGLMTGAPRAASVMAKTDVECYRLDKDVFEDIIHERPAIAEEITHLLVKRQAQLDTAKLDIDKELLPGHIVRQHNEILSTIKRFFSLSI